MRRLFAQPWAPEKPISLPLLAALHRTKKKVPQVLVLAPTRELAIQVANAFRDFAAHMKGINILPIFGGQEYGSQLNQLKKGAQIIVGTPGRVMDHIKKGTLDTSGIHSFVLDEADEMLKMGFLEDVQWILEQLTAREHTALFSATMPDNIRKIAQIHLHNPVEIRIASPMTTAQTVRQKAILINGGFNKKIDAALNVLETIHYEGVLLFVRTKIQTLELAEKLSAKGYKATALNGDIQQSHRIRTIEQLKKGAIDILVATDVAARGLDVDRISHVINFDIPFETEAYVHRIGRTGRAGRSGDAILFVTPRERPMLKAIERATGQKISMGRLPTISEINTIRIEKFKQQINAALTEDISFYEKLISEYSTESGKDTARIAAALAYLHQGKAPLLLAEKKRPQRTSKNDTENCFTPKDRRNRKRSHHIQLPPEEGLERFRLE
ncbi:MAG: ATP-dependent RNA helicase, partial [Desulfobulbus propionicus]